LVDQGAPGAEMLEFIAEHTSDVFIRVSADGVITYASPSIRAYGYQPSDVVGTNGLQLIHPDDREHFMANSRALLAGEDSETADRVHRFLRADGEVIWIEGNPTAVRGPDGRADGFVNVFRDATRRRNTEAALANSEARYRAIAERTADVIAVSDNDGLITFMSPSIRRLGFEPGELIGKTFAPYTHPDDAGQLWKSLMSQERGGHCARLRWRAMNQATGEWVWQESAPSRLWDEVTGEPAGFLDVVRDVSDQVAQEAALFDARAEAEAATVVKSQFLANMSHEIRTPLTAVLGFTGLLAQSASLDEKARAHVDRIATAGSALLAIVNDILDFSKLEAGRVEVRPHPTDVAAVGRETLALFMGTAAIKGLELDLAVAPGVPEVVMLDADRLRQVLVNLTGNAVKFTDAGAVRVRIASAEDGRALRFEVEDTGPGLDGEQCARLFQRFNQIDGSTTRKHGGTGLGLAICKGIVEAMGGEIGVTSTPGQGSVFHLVLPAEAAVTADQAAAEEGASISGLRVMVVDDNPANRELARRFLEAFGAEVSDAVGGAEALEQLASLPVDAVLMDLRMPQVDGREALRRLREQPGPNQAVPVLAFTADAEVGDGAGLEAFDGVIRKPIDPLDMAARIAATMAAPDPRAARATA
jgi:PAS domain S-box-containing protein